MRISTRMGTSFKPFQTIAQTPLTATNPNALPSTKSSTRFWLVTQAIRPMRVQASMIPQCCCKTTRPVSTTPPTLRSIVPLMTRAYTITTTTALCAHLASFLAMKIPTGFQATVVNNDARIINFV